MDISFTWQSYYLEPVTSIALISIGFIVFWFFTNSDFLQRLCKKRYGKEKSLILIIVFQKLFGIIMFGIIPFLIFFVVFPCNLTDYGLKFSNLLISLYLILLLSAILIPMIFFTSGKSENLKHYPQIRVKEWNIKLIIINSLIWIAYLLAYEFLFRGILLFSWVYVIGVWPAIAINTSIYACTHIPKGFKEAIGAIPFGIILCIITLITGNIWVAFFAHVLLALSNDYFALYHNLEMKIIRR